MEMHERGEAAPSLTILDGIPAIRAAIIDHRTEARDIDAFIGFLEAALRRARKEPHDFGARSSNRMVQARPGCPRIDVALVVSLSYFAGLCFRTVP